MIRISLIFIIYLTPFFVFSKNDFQVDFNIGYLFQEKIQLNNQDLNNINSHGIRLGINYIRKLSNNFNAEIGLYSKYNGVKNHIETLAFKTHNLRLQIPVFISYNIGEIWKIGLGVSVENNKDFDKINNWPDPNHERYNYRYDLLTKVNYSYNKNIEFTLYTNWIISSHPNMYNVVSPKNGVYFGVLYNLKKK